MLAPEAVVDHRTQTPYSDPGRWVSLLVDAGPSIPEVSALVRNVVAHYRAHAAVLPASTRSDVDLRWVEAILEADQNRHALPLREYRSLERRVQGCCRDHTLLAVAVLRAQGVPARSRVGFASYLSEGWHHDHVIVEAWVDGRWRRFDPEIEAARPGLDDPTDVPAGTGAPFQTAAEVWTGHRRGALDVRRFGVAEGIGLAGDWFVHGYVITEVAHRFGDELLLWDQWGAMTGDLATAPQDRIELVDEVADLLVRADGGDMDAETQLHARYVGDDRLRPGNRIRSYSPTGTTSSVDLGSRLAEPFEIVREG